ncbi:MAG: acyl-CoA dehydrogenase family protein, partial [Bacteriovoracia bacterium]
MKKNIPLPSFENLYNEDPIAGAFWSFIMGEEKFREVSPLLTNMGRSAALATPLAARADLHSPVLESQRPDGEVSGRVDYHPDYEKLKELAYDGRLIQIKYDSDFRARHNQIRHRTGFAMGFYFAQSEIGLYCPVCMTDGVARVLERHGKDPVCRDTIQRLSATAPEELWQGAMFLTEKQGGSDVGANTTQARFESGKWFLSGEKWFCSNADA